MGDGAGPRSRSEPEPEPVEAPSVRVAPRSPWWLDPLGGSVAAVTALITRGDMPRIFTTLAKNRRLYVPWLPFASSFLLWGELPRADSELVVLRTAWNTASWYEWAQHVALARRAGLSEEAIERVPGGPAADGWTPRQRLLLEATDELDAHHVIGDHTWAALASELPERQLIELCLLVGHYEMLAMTLNSLGVEPEASALRRLRGSAAEACDTLRRKLTDARRT